MKDVNELTAEDRCFKMRFSEGHRGSANKNMKYMKALAMDVNIELQRKIKTRMDADVNSGVTTELYVTVPLIPLMAVEVALGVTNYKNFVDGINSWVKAYNLYQERVVHYVDKRSRVPKPLIVHTKLRELKESNKWFTKMITGFEYMLNARVTGKAMPKRTVFKGNACRQIAPESTITEVIREFFHVIETSDSLVDNRPSETRLEIMGSSKQYEIELVYFGWCGRTLCTPGITMPAVVYSRLHKMIIDAVHTTKIEAGKASTGKMNSDHTLYRTMVFLEELKAAVLSTIDDKKDVSKMKFKNLLLDTGNLMQTYTTSPEIRSCMLGNHKIGLTE